MKHQPDCELVMFRAAKLVNDKPPACTCGLEKVRELAIKIKGYYDGIDDRLIDAIKKILALLAEPESKEPDHIPEAEKKVGTGEFVKKVKRAIVDLVTVAPDDEEAAREAIVVLYNACDRLEALQAKLEAAKKRENYVECLEAGLRDRDTKLKVAFEVISMLKEKGIG